MSIKHKIYCFCNNKTISDWNEIVAIADDGNCLASHICSASCFFKHDIGIESNWKHELYNKHFGEGNWELVWVEEPEKSEELANAIALNLQLAEGAAKLEAAKEVPSSDSE